jgi:hypothetical protein
MASTRAARLKCIKLVSSPVLSSCFTSVYPLDVALPYPLTLSRVLLSTPYGSVTFPGAQSFVSISHIREGVALVYLEPFVSGNKMIDSPPVFAENEIFLRSVRRQAHVKRRALDYSSPTVITAHHGIVLMIRWRQVIRRRLQVQAVAQSARHLEGEGNESVTVREWATDT